MDFMTAISAAAQATGIVKDLRDIDKGFDLAEVRARMAGLYGNLADVKNALTEAQGEVRAKDAEIARLKSAFEYRGKLVERKGYKFQAFESGEPKGEPFCRRCERHGYFSRLTPVESGDPAMICPECKMRFGQVPSFPWEEPKR